MVSKKFFRILIAASMLATVPSELFAASTDEADYDFDGGLYIKGFYSPSMISSQKFEKSGETATKAKGDATSPANGTVSGEYKPEYELNWMRGGAAIGYSYSGARIELEGIFNGDTKTKEIAPIGLTDGQKTNQVFYGLTIVPSEVAQLQNVTQAAVAVENKKFNYMMGWLNFYYDISMNSPFVPFVGAGVGWGKMTINTVNGKDDAEFYPIGLQGKAGAKFDLVSMVGMHVQPYVSYVYSYFMKKAADKATTGLPVLAEGVTGSVSGVEYTIEQNHSSHNIEVGLSIPLGA